MRKQRQTHGEEVANVLTHGAGMLFGLTAIVVLMIAGIRTGDPWVIGSFAVYALCMTSSYVTSTFYHAASDPKRKCQLAAVIGVWFSFRRMKKKDNLKTVCYLLMSWVVIIAFKPLIDVFQRTDSMYVLYWLIGGGLFYSLGTIFFFLDKYKYMHSAWHLFVLGGTVCHFIAIYNLV